MEIGVKFCGGCNSKYDRGDALSRLKRKLPAVTWVSGEVPLICDYWLLICGCSRKCINDNFYLARKEVIVLKSFSDFNGVVEKICVKDEVKSLERKELHIGDTASIQQTITREMVFKFAELTGDFNKMHVDDGYSAEQWFKRPVAHGMISASLLSAVMGTLLPGDGTIILETQMKFNKPVFLGDQITAEVTLVAIENHKRYAIGTFTGICRNQDGVAVTEMTAKQMLMGNLFIF